MPNNTHKRSTDAQEQNATSQDWSGKKQREPTYAIIEPLSKSVVQRKDNYQMPNLEERLQALEQEHTELKKTIELQTIAIGALVNKATLEKLNEKYDKLFEALIAHDSFTNGQLAELRNQQNELDGKVVGLQTEMRQRFTEQDSKIAGLDSKVAGLDNKVAGLDNKIAGLDSKVAGLDSKVAGLDSKVVTLQTTQVEHTTLLQQILARLPEKL